MNPGLLLGLAACREPQTAPCDLVISTITIYLNTGNIRKKTRLWPWPWLQFQYVMVGVCSGHLGLEPGPTPQWPG